MLKALWPALACAAFACPALAQETAGTITGLLGDAPASWTFDATQSDFSGDAGYASVSIAGWPEEVPEGVAMISIGFDLQQGMAQNPEIRLMPKGNGPVLFNREVEVTLTEAVIEGETLRLSGSLSGPMGLTSDHGANVDMSEPRHIDLSFDGLVATP